MAVLFRWLLRIFLGLVIVTVAGVGLVWYLASRSIPDYNASFSLKGLKGKVEIVRDRNDVPHIFARNDLDSFYALGFVHAQDRLWQMTMLRRRAQGRLSESFGPETVPVDTFLRQLDLYGLAERAVAAQAPQQKAELEAYAAGVNAWIRTVRDQALGRGAPEFFLFSNRIEPWRPADSIALLKLMALQLSGQMRAEILRAQVSLALGRNSPRVRDILPDAPGPGAAALPEYGSLFPAARRSFAQAGPPEARLPFDPVPQPGMEGASNAWAAAPSRTATRATLLANDPHLAFTAPTIWYLARMQLTTGDVIGGTIPGIPAILIGRSARLGWGLTSSYMDDQDVYIERVNPNNPDEYLTPDGYKPFITREVTIKVKGAPDVKRTLRWTENGPVIPSDRYDVGAITPQGDVAALSWTALEPDDTSMTATMRLMRAGSVREAIEAERDFVAPSQNLMLADKTSIALQTVGRMPNRQAGSQTRGRLPAPGWVAENRWLGTMPYEANPRFIDPSGGILANTNNKIVDRPFPYHVSYVWGDTQRIERLQKLLGSRKVHTLQSFKEAQLDEVSFSARALLPLIARDLWYEAETPAPDKAGSLRRTALTLLAGWNGEMNEHMPEPLIYAAWMRSLQRLLIQDELGPLARKFTHPDPIFLERVFRNVDGASAWCDRSETAPRETCSEIARTALDQALLGLAKTYGDKVESWRWGDAHQATHDHQVLGKLPVLKWFVNIRQSTSGGDNTLLRGKTRGTGPNPYLNVHGAGYRGVYDLADPDSSVFIIATGQSGHFLSRYYDDLAQLWRRGEYIPMSLNPELARAGAIGTTTLTPAP